jgi:O-antigen/teichoic acid export membrane protein
MSEKAKRNFLRWFIIEIVTLVIATVHFMITPDQRPYAVPAYCIVLLGAVALVICWIVYKKRHRNK